ncbi:MAG TPA: thiamine phosphate synthase [Beijerinckiaceae bacterium]|jgi:thiamine-phosphate pyrophosphorylase
MPTLASAAINPVDLRVYAILGPEQGSAADLARLARAAVEGGATLVQVRDKGSDARRFVEAARAVKAALAGTGVPVLVNDRVDVAAASGADGVHLGQDDLHPQDARRLLGRQAIIGLTVKTPAQADELYRLPVDYACIGGVFATASKANPEPPVGLEGFSRIAFRARLAAPGITVGAIAGIGRENAGDVIAAGADGIAVISAIFGRPDPRDAAREFRTIVDRTLASRGAAP